MARTALEIPSSSDLSRFLVDVAPRYLGRNVTALREAYFKAVGSVPSSTDLSTVLLNAVPFASKSSEIATSVIAAAATVPSSTDRARVLVALAASGAVRTTGLRDAYLEVTSKIESSTEMRRALEALPRN